jgi:hypothetical protein
MLRMPSPGAAPGSKRSIAEIAEFLCRDVEEVGGQDRRAPRPVSIMRIDSHHLDQEAARLERRSRAYVIITALVLLLFAFAFIWLTW